MISNTQKGNSICISPFISQAMPNPKQEATAILTFGSIITFSINTVKNTAFMIADNTNMHIQIATGV